MGSAQGHPDHRLVEVDAARRPLEVGACAEGEDAAVGRHEVVAVAARGGDHPDDGLIERLATQGSKERCVEAEDPAVGGDQPVATGRGIGGDGAVPLSN